MKNIRGFTLIYLALFGIIIGGVSAGVYAIIEGAGRTQTKIFLQEEGDFLTAKINWALSGASDISVASNPLGLKVDKFVYANNPLVFNLTGNDLTLSEGAGAPQILNPSAVKVGNLILQDIPGQPEGVLVSFTLSAPAQNGSVITQDFEVTKYLRK